MRKVNIYSTTKAISKDSKSVKWYMFLLQPEHQTKPLEPVKVVYQRQSQCS